MLSVSGRDVAFRARFDTWLLRQRLLGTLIVKLETARLARTLGTLLRNGVPLLSALRISRNVLSNAALVDDLGSVAEDVKNGLGLAGALGVVSVSPLGGADDSGW